MLLLVGLDCNVNCRCLVYASYFAFVVSNKAKEDCYVFTKDKAKGGSLQQCLHA